MRIWKRPLALSLMYSAIDQQRSGGACAPYGIAVVVQPMATIPVKLPTWYQRIAKAAMFLENLVLGDWDALALPPSIWRFSGVFEDGRPFEVQVQALTDEYISDQ